MFDFLEVNFKKSYASTSTTFSNNCFYLEKGERITLLFRVRSFRMIDGNNINNPNLEEAI